MHQCHLLRHPASSAGSSCHRRRRRRRRHAGLHFLLPSPSLQIVVVYLLIAAVLALPCVGASGTSLVTARWVTITSNILLETTAGTSYAFGTYSNQLREDLGYSQDDLQTIASIGNVGLYLAVVAGIVYDRYGPKPCLAIGAILSLGGYLLMWAAADQRIDYSVPLMSLYAFLWSHGSSWFDTVAIGINIQNFPHDRGSATGLLKSFFGLSASVVTLIDNTFFADSSVPFLLFLGVLGGISGAVAFFTSFRARFKGPNDEYITPFEKRIFLVAMIGLAVLATYLTVISVLEAQGVLIFANWQVYVMFPLLLWQLVLLTPVVRQRYGWWREEAAEAVGAGRAGGGGETAPLLSGQRPTLEAPAAPLAESTFTATKTVEGVPSGVSSSDSDTTKEGNGGISSAATAADEVVASPEPPSWRDLGAVLLDVNFWLLNVTFFAGCGGGLVIINNITQQVQSLMDGTYVDGDEAVFVTILSVSNCIGRLMWGFLSDRYPRVTRAGWWTCVALSMTGAMFVTAAASEVTIMYLCCAWSGISYGGYWALVAPLLADVWGTEWIAAIYTLASLCPALSSYVFSVALTSTVYTQNIPPGEPDGICLGPECFRLSYIVLGAVNAGGALAAGLLAWRVHRAKTGGGAYVQLTHDAEKGASSSPKTATV